MKLKTVAEVVKRFYYSGRVKATNLTIQERDFLQLIKMGYANKVRTLYYAYRQGSSGDEYYVASNNIVSKDFPVPEKDGRGRRRVDLSNIDFIIMPQNAHILNVTPKGDGCGEDITIELSQVQPGEERFYSGPDMSIFKFFVMKGDYIDTYNLPDCIKEVEIEAVYDNDDIDIPLDMAYEICNEVLGTSLKVKGFPVNGQDNSYNPYAVELKNQLQEKQ